MKFKLENLMKIIKDKNLYFCFLITMTYFGIFIIRDYATDTYLDFVLPAKTIFYDVFMCSGRFMTSFFWGITYILKFSDSLIYLSSYALAIICMTFSIYNIVLIANKKVKNELICLLLGTIIIINPFSIELFFFLEKGIFGLALLMSVLAFRKFIDFLEGNKKSIIYVFIFMLIATFSYQGVVGIFIVLSSIYLVLYTKNIKDFIKNNVIMFLSYGIPAVINLLTVSVIFTNGRVNGEIILAESIKKILKGTEELFELYKILPENMLLIVSTILILISIILTIANKKERIKGKIFKILGLVYIVLVILVVTLVPQLLQNTSAIWFAPRSTYPFATIIGAFIMYIFIKIYNSNSTNKKLSFIVNLSLGMVMLAVLSIQFFYFSRLEVERYNVNYTDKINSLKIGEEISKYQEETGITVTRICLYRDKGISSTYPYINTNKELNVSAFYPDWSIINMINYYNNIDLKEEKPDERIQEEFSKKDWNNFSTEQIIFIGDTLHYCKF